MQSAFWRLFRDFGAAQLPPDAAIRVILPNGAESIVGNAHARPADLATVRVIDAALFGKVVMRSDIGLGEGACASKRPRGSRQRPALLASPMHANG